MLPAPKKWAYSLIVMTIIFVLFTRFTDLANIIAPFVNLWYWFLPFCLMTVTIISITIPALYSKHDKHVDRYYGMIRQQFRKHYRVMDESVFSRLPGSLSKDKDQWKIYSCTKPQENCKTVSSQMNALITGFLEGHCLAMYCIPRFSDFHHF